MEIEIILFLEFLQKENKYIIIILKENRWY